MLLISRIQRVPIRVSHFRDFKVQEARTEGPARMEPLLGVLGGNKLIPKGSGRRGRQTGTTKMYGTVSQRFCSETVRTISNSIGHPWSYVLQTRKVYPQQDAMKIVSSRCDGISRIRW